VEFEILGEIRDIEAIAIGHGIRIYARLIRDFGHGNWRKMKGAGTVRLPNGRVVDAELHWYEAHGIGKRKMKIKRYFK
jgi:hypothetical protein